VTRLSQGMGADGDFQAAASINADMEPLTARRSNTHILVRS